MQPEGLGKRRYFRPLCLPNSGRRESIPTRWNHRRRDRSGGRGSPHRAPEIKWIRPDHRGRVFEQTRVRLLRRGPMRRVVQAQRIFQFLLFADANDHATIVGFKELVGYEQREELMLS